jgi:hypothetical protein
MTNVAVTEAMQDKARCRTERHQICQGRGDVARTGERGVWPAVQDPA